MNPFFAFLFLPAALHTSPLVDDGAALGRAELRPKPLVDAAEAGRKAPESSDAVSLIRIDKSDHRLELVAGSRVVKTYRVAIGSGGMGPKRFEGDKTTPVGTYYVTSRFKGLFHQFLGVSYPNDDDRARYAELKRQGIVPPGRGVGNSIGIHGVGSKELAGAHKLADWTHGCIALDDDEIDELSRLVKDKTTIVIVD